MAKSATAIKILTIDIGGSHVKATLLNSEGKLLMNYQKVVTPAKASPENLIAAIKALVKNFPAYDNISVGFPGYVKDGKVFANVEFPELIIRYTTNGEVPTLKSKVYTMPITEKGMIKFKVFNKIGRSGNVTVIENK